MARGVLDKSRCGSSSLRDGRMSLFQYIQSPNRVEGNDNFVPTLHEIPDTAGCPHESRDVDDGDAPLEIVLGTR